MNPYNYSPKELREMANRIRKWIIKSTAEAGSGHPGGSLSIADVLAVLYFKTMAYKSDEPKWQGRDYLLTSKGHITPAYYAVLAEAGFFPTDELLTFRKFGSRLQGHPSVADNLPGVEVAAGSLGQGLSIGCGVAMALKSDGISNRVYCITGDGEWQEGSMWEAAMTASHFNLDNLTAIIDFNRLQIDGLVSDVMNIEPFAEKMIAFGWTVIECDGHNIEQLITTFEQVRAISNQPQMIIAHTIKGKGVSFMEDNAEWHGKATSREEALVALAELDKIEEAIS